jgi:hypothetical protein
MGKSPEVVGYGAMLSLLRFAFQAVIGRAGRGAA